ncbi:MAG: hypothetical protein IPK82_02550 [Polyangiaceae bacterium]|nr:hypothetical protein [Polyangiaceae bacterium]
MIAVRIDAAFDGGSIINLGADGSTATLSLRSDSDSNFLQWFCFRSFDDPGQMRRFHIINAGASEYPDAWDNYRVCASYEGGEWFRVPTTFDGQSLHFEVFSERRGITLAAAHAYSQGRVKRLLSRARRSGLSNIQILGRTKQDRPVPAVTIGSRRANSTRIWVLARQHPGETMASWCAEGLIDRLILTDDAAADFLREEAEITVVPCVNVDGAVLGNHRSNAAGCDLNRSWNAPNLVSTPETFCIAQAIRQSGVDLFIDLHGDESVPHVFMAGCEGNPSFSARIASLEADFAGLLAERNAAFSEDAGYGKDAPGKADLSCAANWVGERFDCLALTLEIPFKEALGDPSPTGGWTPEQSTSLGADLVDVMVSLLPDLR